MKTQIPNIDVVRSAWRRVKKDIKDAIIRDLKPVKDVKGGGGFEGKSIPKAALTPLAATKKDKELHAGALKPPGVQPYWTGENSLPAPGTRSAARQIG